MPKKYQVSFVCMDDKHTGSNKFWHARLLLTEYDSYKPNEPAEVKDA